MMNDRDEETLPQPEPIGRVTRPRRSRIYYGWLLLAAAVIISAATAGVNDSFSILVLPFSKEFGWSRLSISVAFAVGVLVSGLSQPILGHLFDRHSARKVITLSVAAAGFATIALCLTSHLFVLVFLYGIVFSGAMGGASFGVLGPLVARWFLMRRILALSLLVAGTGIGSVVLVPVSSLVMAIFGWRLALIALGAIFLFLALPAALTFVRNWPSDRGLKPDGEPETPMEARMRGSAPVLQRGRYEIERWWRAFRSPPIWALAAVFAVGGFTSSFASTFFASFAVDSLRSSIETASIIYSVMGLLEVAGAVGVGLVADRFPRKRVLGSLLLAQAFAFLVLIAMQNLAGVWLFAVLVGSSGTSWLILALSLIADIYGLRTLATLWGIAFLFYSIGSFVGPAFVGLAIDLTGSYSLAVTVYAAVLVLASIVSFAINERKYSARYEAAVEVEAVGS